MIIRRARKGQSEVPTQMPLKRPGRAKVQDLFQTISKLARLRPATPALESGVLTACWWRTMLTRSLASRTDRASSWCSTAQGHRRSCMFRSEHPGNLNGARREILPGTAPALEARQGALEIMLPPHSAAIYR